MDRPLTRRLTLGVCAAALAGAAGAVRADDPTRPPPGLIAPTPGPAAPGGAGSAQDDAPLPSLQLHAILRPAGRPAVAMINDWTMRVGDRFDDVRLVAIGPVHADVIAAGRRMRLSLVPEATHRLRAGVRDADTPSAASIDRRPARDAVRSSPAQNTKKQPAKES